MSSVTVADLDKLVQELASLETQKDAQAEITKQINKEIQGVEGRIVAHLKDLGREDYLSPLGKLSIREKWRVNMPVDDLAKRALFDHLRSRDIFDRYATVNSNSLNALFMRDWEEAKEKGEGMTFNMPGIGAPTLYESLDFKLKK
jgi:hypothetical protein